LDRTSRGASGHECFDPGSVRTFSKLVGEEGRIVKPANQRIFGIVHSIIPIVASFDRFRVRRTRAWVRFARIVVDVIGFASHHQRFLRSIAHTEPRQDDPTSLSIETSEGLGAIGYRKPRLRIWPPELAIDPDRPVSPSIAHGWIPWLNWSHSGHSLIDVTPIMERWDWIGGRGERDSS
jgi:hypothetical protein